MGSALLFRKAARLSPESYTVSQQHAADSAARPFAEHRRQTAESASAFTRPALCNSAPAEKKQAAIVFSVFMGRSLRFVVSHHQDMKPKLWQQRIAGGFSPDIF
jgi:hypothetical protein